VVISSPLVAASASCEVDGELLGSVALDEPGAPGHGQGEHEEEGEREARHDGRKCRTPTLDPLQSRSRSFAGGIVRAVSSEPSERKHPVFPVPEGFPHELDEETLDEWVGKFAE
jgi:hypothetical protein